MVSGIFDPTSNPRSASIYQKGARERGFGRRKNLVDGVMDDPESIGTVSEMRLEPGKPFVFGDSEQLALALESANIAHPLQDEDKDEKQGSD